MSRSGFDLQQDARCQIARPKVAALLVSNRAELAIRLDACLQKQPQSQRRQERERYTNIQMMIDDFYHLEKQRAN